jgi:hypothetical protein
MENFDKYLFLSMFFIILIILIYIFYVITLESSNCSRIKEYSANGDDTSSIYNEGISALFDVPLNKVFVKTAYNCCCTGRFKNDYVNFCALDNCRNQGVRALHFEVYNLNNTPIIATSSIDRPKYKEMYNYLDFSETMLRISDNFMNISEPLFLIIEINSDLTETYTSVYNSLNSIFKTDIFTNVGKNLNNVTLKELKDKVCIMVSFKQNNTNNFSSSKLNKISYNISNKIINYTSFLSGISDFNNIEFTSDKLQYITGIYVLVSNKQDYTKNYDFTSSGIRYGITFTAMNFQYNDGYLTEYNKLFEKITTANSISTCSFALKYGMTGGNYYSPIVNAILPDSTNSTLTSSVKNTDFYNKLAALYKF